MDLIKKINKKSLIALAIVAAGSAFFDGKKVPAGILIGGILGLANVRGLSWSVEGLMGSYRATGKMIFFSIFRLAILFVIVAALVYFRVVNIFGILIGFTVVFVFLVIEGLKYADKMQG